MTIKEQIEIARMIASGTPREVAISEKVIPTSSMYRDELPPAEKAKARLAAAKERQAELNKPKTSPTRAVGSKLKSAIAAKPIQSVGSMSTIDKDEGDASAIMKSTGNVKKGATKVLNLGKRIAFGRKGEKDNIDYKKLAKHLNKEEFIQEKGGYEKIDISEPGATAMKKVTGNVLKLGIKGVNKVKKLARELKKEEFIQEVEDKKDSKAKKVIDIMKGKNSVKINPDMKEDTVVVQDASGKDFVEIVDIITPQKVRSDWRKEINVTEASAAWTRKEGKKKSGGLNEKGRKSYERQNPGSDLKAPSKKVGNPRRKSFCARMKGMKKKLTSAKTARDPDSRINKSLRAWNC